MAVGIELGFCCRLTSSCKPIAIAAKEFVSATEGHSVGDDIDGCTEADAGLAPDPLFLQSVRESGFILLTWAACFAWTFCYCTVNGYSAEVAPADFPTVLGMPSWVVWGIVLPWTLANAVTLYFCFWYMQDGELDDADSGEPGAAFVDVTRAEGTAS